MARRPVEVIDASELERLVLNPLHRWMIGAAIALGLGGTRAAREGAVPFGHLEDLAEPAAIDDQPARTVWEINSIQRTADDLARRGHRLLYVDRLHYEHRGLDAIAADGRGRVVFVEVKATTRRIGAPLGYLKLTRTKGRQLSWPWILGSVLALGSSPLTAPACFQAIRPLIEGNARRMLYVWPAEFVTGDLPLRAGRPRVFEEADLSAVGELSIPLDRQWARWLAEIDARCPFGSLPGLSKGLA